MTLSPENRLAFLADLTLDVPLAEIPFGAEWVGPWAIQPEAAESLLNVLRGLDLRAHLQQRAAEGKANVGGTPQVSSEAIAFVSLRGTLMKQQASAMRSTSTVAARRMIRAAAADPAVGGILLYMDSPGGTVAGTKELADDIAAAASKKPVYGFAEDLCASACYWAGSQCTRLYTNATGMVGSIGTYMAIADYSGWAAKEGVKVHVVRAGAFKGAGTTGTEITAEQLAKWQAEVNQLNEHFLAGVAAGRKLPLETVRQLADGNVYIGKKAVENKLVDGVATADHVVNELLKAVSASKVKGSRMSANPATLAEIRTACLGASAEFILAQAEKGATIEQAKDAFIAHLLDANTAAKNEAEQAKNEAAQAKSEAAQAKQSQGQGTTQTQTQTQGKRPGVEALGDRGTGTATADIDGDPIVAFNEQVAAAMKGGRSKQDAVVAVALKNPALHQAYVAATNPGRKAQRLIAEKYED